MATATLKHPNCAEECAAPPENTPCEMMGLCEGRPAWSACFSDRTSGAFAPSASGAIPEGEKPHTADKQHQRPKTTRTILPSRKRQTPASLAQAESRRMH